MRHNYNSAVYLSGFHQLPDTCVKHSKLKAKTIEMVEHTTTMNWSEPNTTCKVRARRIPIFPKELRSIRSNKCYVDNPHACLDSATKYSLLFLAAAASASFIVFMHILFAFYLNSCFSVFFGFASLKSCFSRNWTFFSSFFAFHIYFRISFLSLEEFSCNFPWSQFCACVFESVGFSLCVCWDSYFHFNFFRRVSVHHCEYLILSIRSHAFHLSLSIWVKFILIQCCWVRHGDGWQWYQPV